MNRMHYTIKFLALLATLVLVNCVSVKLSERKVIKSSSTLYVIPSKPFYEVKNQHLDKAWQNKNTGGTISYLSDCNNPVDTSLDNILRGIISEIEHANVIESSQVTYNDRDALHAYVSGKVDGVNSQVELIIFKKNNCTYILTYAAAAKVFGENQREVKKSHRVLRSQAKEKITSFAKESKINEKTNNYGKEILAPKTEPLTRRRANSSKLYSSDSDVDDNVDFLQVMKNSN